MHGVCVLILLCWGGVQGDQGDQKIPSQENPTPAPAQKPEAQDPKTPSQEPPLRRDLNDLDSEEDEDLDFIAAVRVGGWRIGGFHAQTPGGGRRIDSSLLFDAGIDLCAAYSGWSLELTGDYGESKDIRVEMGGILLGVSVPIREQPLPIELQISIGPVFGRLDVAGTGFGSFESAVGFEARLSATSWMIDSLGVSLWVDYRQISFAYSGAVTSGDTRTGGATFAVGAGLLMRF